MASQSRGNFMLRNDISDVSSGRAYDGRRTVFGTGTFTLVARQLLKNFSSALHQNGLLMTAVPLSAAFLR